MSNAIIVVSTATLVAACSRVVAIPEAARRCERIVCEPVLCEPVLEDRWEVREVTRGRRSELGKKFTGRVVLSQVRVDRCASITPHTPRDKEVAGGLCLTHGGLVPTPQ